jgi:capsular exopolysaccharide synthesis family protein
MRIVLRRHWFAVVLLTLLGALASGALSFTATPSYTSTASVYFSLPSGTSGSDLSQGSNYTQSQMLSFAALATQPIVLNPVVDELHLGVTAKQLSNRIQAQASNDTVVIDLSASDTSPTRAADIANSVADHLSKTVVSLSPKTESGRATIDATIVATALPPSFASSPKTRRNILAGTLSGLILGVLIAVGRERLDTRVRSSDEVRALTDVAVLGEVSAARSSLTHRHVMQRQPHSLEAEAYRRIATNLDYLAVDGAPLTIVVTSAVSAEGKSSTCINVGSALAETHKRVLLIDADLRRPSLADYMDLEGGAGLSSVLIGRAQFADVVQPWGDGLMDVVASGTVPPNPTELLGSSAMFSLLQEVREKYDVVLIDCAPLLPVTDAAVLARIATGTLLVAGCRQLHQHQLLDALDALSAVDARVLGIVVNQVKQRDTHLYDPYTAIADRRPRGRQRLLSRPLRRLSRVAPIDRLRRTPTSTGTTEPAPSGGQDV